MVMRCDEEQAETQKEESLQPADGPLGRQSKRRRVPSAKCESRDRAVTTAKRKSLITRGTQASKQASERASKRRLRPSLSIRSTRLPSGNGEWNAQKRWSRQVRRGERQGGKMSCV